MATDMREKVHNAVNRLSEAQLAETLHFIELLAATPEGADIEPEEMWLLASGALKRMVDETADAPPPVNDWRSRLHDL
jgi:hypothetical protein